MQTICHHLYQKKEILSSCYLLDFLVGTYYKDEENNCVSIGKFNNLIYYISILKIY